MGKNFRPNTALPGGATRIAEVVVEAIAMTSAREVQGVLDIAVMEQAAPMKERESVFIDDSGERVSKSYQQTFDPGMGDRPLIRLHLSAAYGADLERVAREVRHQVQEALLHRTGLAVRAVEIVFTEVILHRGGPLLGCGFFNHRLRAF